MSQNNLKGYVDESGSAHLTRENNVGDSILTQNSGATPPSYALKGTEWLDTSVTPHIRKQYDGTNWIIIGELDLTNDKFPIHCAGYAQSSAPSNPVPFTQWLDTTATPWVHKIFDGADWITVGTMNATSNTYAPVAHNHSGEALIPTSIQLGGTGVVADEILDEDDMSSDDATALCSQQSIKAYIDNLIGAIAIFQDQKSQNTEGGSSSVGWNTRDLNTTLINQISGCSLSSNQITLPAGTYEIRAKANQYRGGECVAAIYDTTGASYILTGINDDGSVGGNEGALSEVEGVITLGVESDLELRHYFSNALATDGLGQAVNVTTEVYSSIKIRKLP
jgi:hypothetical protein